MRDPAGSNNREDAVWTERQKREYCERLERECGEA
jgi:hypothetical protein